MYLAALGSEGPREGLEANGPELSGDALREGRGAEAVGGGAETLVLQATLETPELQSAAASCTQFQGGCAASIQLWTELQTEKLQKVEIQQEKKKLQNQLDE